MILPAQLKQHPNWVGWKYITKDSGPTKVPFDVKTGQPAKANDPSTWATFEQTVAVADPLTGSGADYAGIGFELGGTDFVGIDFDNAIDKKGVVDLYALAILKVLGNPYTERSPSGRGAHAFVECSALPEGKRKLSQDHTGIEIYHGREGGRYFTVTGDRILGDGVPKIADISLAYILITQNKDKKFKRLWLGDTSDFDGDDSSADFALLMKLASLTENDEAKMEAYFSASGLGQREKWTDRSDYRERSISGAVKRLVKGAIETNRTGKYELPPEPLKFAKDPVADPDSEYVIAPANGQMDGWFPLGDISLIGGASGTGKTTWIFELLRSQLAGHPVLEHRTMKRPFHVLAYDRGKNAFNRTMRRLQLMVKDVPTTPLPLAFGTNAVQNIVNEIEKITPTPQVIFLEGLDMLVEDANKKSIVSPFMKQLQEVAAHFHIALIGSLGAPKAKRGEDYAAKRDHLSGSEAWGRNCETVVVLEFTDDDDGTAPRRSLTILPRNAPAEKFTLEFQDGKLANVTAQAAQEDAMNGKKGAPDDKRDRAKLAIQQVLQKGPVLTRQVRSRVDDLGLGIKDGTFDNAFRELCEENIVRLLPNKTCELIQAHATDAASRRKSAVDFEASPETENLLGLGVK